MWKYILILVMSTGNIYDIDIIYSDKTKENVLTVKSVLETSNHFQNKCIYELDSVYFDFNDTIKIYEYN